MKRNGIGEHVLGTSYSSSYFRQFIFTPFSSPPLPNTIMNGIWSLCQSDW
jgi:hypothetical protein